MDESSASKGGLWWATALTILYLGVIFYLRGYDALDLLYGGKLNELGDFFAGVFSPVAFGWLIYGYFLQSKELSLQRKELSLQNKELGLQRKELERTGNTLIQQTAVLQEQAEAERRRSTPYLSLHEGGVSGGQRDLILVNFGSPARNIEETLLEESPRTGVLHHYERPSLDTDKTFSFTISDASSSPTDSRSYFYTVCFTSEIHQRLYQRWRIIFTRKTAGANIQPITDGPEPLKQGQSPPPPPPN